MASRTQVIWTRQLRWAEHGQHWLGAQFLVLRVISTRTRQLTLIQRRDSELQQFAQGGCSGLVESCPECALHGSQVGSAVVATLRKDSMQ